MEVAAVINPPRACAARVTVCVCVRACVRVWCVEDRKELELRGGFLRHLCVRPPRCTCTSVRAAIIDTWPTNYVKNSPTIFVSPVEKNLNLVCVV